MLFSATLSYRVLELAYDHMNSPEKVTVETDNVTADRVRQVVYFPATEEKMPLLLNLLGKLDDHRSIVFINTKAMAERVTRALERNGHRVATLSGDVPQAKRERLLARFQKGDIELLVATDVAARGLHIPAVTHVFNFDLPQDAEDYVHRIGRTARLGAEGDAISFACDLYAMGLPDIETYIGQKIPTERVEPDLLVIPPARVRERPAISDEDDAANAADDLRNTAGAPPKHSKSAPRGPAGSRGHERDGGRRSGNSASRPSRPAPAAPAVAPAVAAEAAAAPAAASAPSDPSKKRRRRGGRGRKRSGTVETGASAHPETAVVNRSEAPKSERKPRRERTARAEHGEGRTTPEATVPAGTHRKQGFFNRIASFFGRH
jgi:ATP-dependent RNA helicase RhlB